MLFSRSHIARFALVPLSILGFALAQDGAPATHAQRHGSASVAIVMDNSKSARNRTEALRNAARKFVDGLGDDAYVSLWSAADAGVSEQDLTSDTRPLLNRLKHLKSHGKLALYDAVSGAARQLRNDGSNDNLAVVAFVAGADQGSKESVSLLEDDVRGSPSVHVYVIAMPDVGWRSQQVLQQISFSSGGQAFFPTHAGDAVAVAQEAARKLRGEPVDSTSARLEDQQHNDKPLAGYQTILVRSVPVANSNKTEEFAGGDNDFLHDTLLWRMRNSKLFPQVLDGENDNTVEAAANTRARTVELLATIVEYRRGNRTQRELLLFRGGAKIKVQVVLRDLATHTPLLSFTEEGTGASGLFAGSDEHVHQAAINDLAAGIVSRIRKERK